MTLHITPTRSRVALSGLALAALAAVAAGCGGGGGRATAATPATTAATTPAPQPDLSVASTHLGKVLVDSHGRTLYLFTRDTGMKSACAGACTTAWPPLLVRGKPMAGSGVDPSLLASFTRSDGTTQATYAGHPLYRFVKDHSPGEAHGEGASAFGGSWLAVSPGGKAVKTAGSAAKPARPAPKPAGTMPTATTQSTSTITERTAPPPPAPTPVAPKPAAPEHVERKTTTEHAAPPPPKAPAPERAPKPEAESGGGIPQNNGGDGDADNNGGPSDGDGNV